MNEERKDATPSHITAKVFIVVGYEGEWAACGSPDFDRKNMTPLEAVGDWNLLENIGCGCQIYEVSVELPTPKIHTLRKITERFKCKAVGSDHGPGGILLQLEDGRVVITDEYYSEFLSAEEYADRVRTGVL